VPSQLRAGISVDPVQLPATHCVPAAQKRQAPAPLHTPSRPHVVAAVPKHWLAATGAVPLGTFEQVPSAVASAHVLHVPVHAVSQQRPCAQKPELHSAAAVHVAPIGLSEHVVPLQMFGDTQCASVEHVLRQMPAVVSHWNATQDCVVAAAQAPAPSQSCGGLYVDPVHDAATHCVPITCLRQAPAPLHVPSLPQVDAAAAGHWPATTGGAPAETGEHVPVLHAMHVPVHAVLQHTPCTQKPDAQSVPTPDGHRPPMGILPQLMATHVLPVTHSLVAAHVVRHAVPAAAHV